MHLEKDIYVCSGANHVTLLVIILQTVGYEPFECTKIIHHCISRFKLLGNTILTEDPHTATLLWKCNVIPAYSAEECIRAQS